MNRPSLHVDKSRTQWCLSVIRQRKLPTARVVQYRMSYLMRSLSHHQKHPEKRCQYEAGCGWSRWTFTIYDLMKFKKYKEKMKIHIGWIILQGREESVGSMRTWAKGMVPAALPLRSGADQRPQEVLRKACCLHHVSTAKGASEPLTTSSKKYHVAWFKRQPMDWKLLEWSDKFKWL